MLKGKIIRSKRKTVSFQITENAELIIRVPYKMDKISIYQMIEKHKDWIEKKQQEMIKRSQLTHKFINNEEFFYLGNRYKLQFVKGQKTPLIFDDGFFLSQDYLHYAKEILLEWYKAKSYEIIFGRLTFYASKYGFKYEKFNITNAQKRWGSCSSNGNLNFSWKLVMAPLDIIDYVVVHELVHLVERNHSKSFWRKVKMIYPEYEKYHNWLKENGYLFKL